jgi:hypothetical protein
MPSIRFLFRLCLLMALALGWCSAAAAQTGAPGLVLSAPEPRSTTGPDVTVVVELTGPAEAPVVFSVVLDGVPAELEDPATGRGGATANVNSGGRTAVVIRGVPEGTHQVRAVAIPAGAASASAINTFRVDVRGFNLMILLATLGVLAVFVLYRRRILGPWADRYDRGAGRPEADEDE